LPKFFFFNKKYSEKSLEFALEDRSTIPHPLKNPDYAPPPISKPSAALGSLVNSLSSFLSSGGGAFNNGENPSHVQVSSDVGGNTFSSLMEKAKTSILSTDLVDKSATLLSSVGLKNNLSEKFDAIKSMLFQVTTTENGPTSSSAALSFDPNSFHAWPLGTSDFGGERVLFSPGGWITVTIGDKTQVCPTYLSDLAYQAAGEVEQKDQGSDSVNFSVDQQKLISALTGGAINAGVADSKSSGDV
jgi:hypothetical protein